MSLQDRISRAVTDPTGRYKGNNYDPNYAQKRQQQSYRYDDPYGDRERQSGEPRPNGHRSNAPYPQPTHRYDGARDPRQPPPRERTPDREGPRPQAESVSKRESSESRPAGSSGDSAAKQVEEHLRTPTSSWSIPSTAPAPSPLDSLAKLRQFKADVEATRARGQDQQPEVESASLASMAEQFLRSQQQADDPIARETLLRERLQARQTSEAASGPLSTLAKRISEREPGEIAASENGSQNGDGKPQDVDGASQAAKGSLRDRMRSGSEREDPSVSRSLGERMPQVARAPENHLKETRTSPESRDSPQKRSLERSTSPTRGAKRRDEGRPSSPEEVRRPQSRSNSPPKRYSQYPYQIERSATNFMTRSRPDDRRDTYSRSPEKIVPSRPVGDSDAPRGDLSVPHQQRVLHDPPPRQQYRDYQWVCGQNSIVNNRHNYPDRRSDHRPEPHATRMSTSRSRSPVKRPSVSQSRESQPHFAPPRSPEANRRDTTLPPLSPRPLIPASDATLETGSLVHQAQTTQQVNSKRGAHYRPPPPVVPELVTQAAKPSSPDASILTTPSAPSRILTTAPPTMASPIAPQPPAMEQSEVMAAITTMKSQLARLEQALLTRSTSPASQPIFILPPQGDQHAYWAQAAALGNHPIMVQPPYPFFASQTGLPQAPSPAFQPMGSVPGMNSQSIPQHFVATATPFIPATIPAQSNIEASALRAGDYGQQVERDDAEARRSAYHSRQKGAPPSPDVSTGDKPVSLSPNKQHSGYNPKQYHEKREPHKPGAPRGRGTYKNQGHDRNGTGNHDRHHQAYGYNQNGYDHDRNGATRGGYTRGQGGSSQSRERGGYSGGRYGE